MNSSPFETAPRFNPPIAALKLCRDRMPRQVRTMQNLVAYTPKSAQDIDMQQAPQAVLRYFSVAASHHHADEEQDFLPMLRDTAESGDASVGFASS